jgi:hypothetical protein
LGFLVDHVKPLESDTQTAQAIGVALGSILSHTGIKGLPAAGAFGADGGAEGVLQPCLEELIANLSGVWSP